MDDWHSELIHRFGPTPVGTRHECRSGSRDRLGLALGVGHALVSITLVTAIFEQP